MSAATTTNPSPGTGRNTADISSDMLTEQQQEVKRQFSFSEPINKKFDESVEADYNIPNDATGGKESGQRKSAHNNDWRVQARGVGEQAAGGVRQRGEIYRTVRVNGNSTRAAGRNVQGRDSKRRRLIAEK